MENDRDNNQLGSNISETNNLKKSWGFSSLPCLTNSRPHDQHVKRPYFEQLRHGKSTRWLHRVESSVRFLRRSSQLEGDDPGLVVWNHWRTYLPHKHPTWVQQVVWLNFCFVIHICCKSYDSFILFLVNWPFFWWFLDVHPVKSPFFIGEIAIFAMEFFQLRLLVQSLSHICFP